MRLKVFTTEELEELKKVDAEIEAEYSRANPASAEKRAKQMRELEERLGLYAAGMTDAEIARCQGVSYATINAWRIKQGLPANIKPKGGKGHG